MYYDQYFNPNQHKQKVEQTSKDQASNQLGLQAFKTHSELNIPRIKELFKDIGAELPII